MDDNPVWHFDFNKKQQFYQVAILKDFTITSMRKKKLFQAFSRLKIAQ